MHGPDIHVSDRGTKYWGRTNERGVNFDPSSATTKQLKFRLADGTVEVRTAQAEQDSDGKWCLTYRTDPSSDADDVLHSKVGQLAIQGFVDFGASTGRWHSDVQPNARDGRTLLVKPNLS